MGENSKQKELELSDWIHYLIHIRNLGYTLVALVLSILVIYFGYLTKDSELLTLQENLGLNVSVLILIFVLIYMTAFKNSPANKTKKILHLIMKGELTDVRKIEKLWFGKKRDKMNYANDKDIERRNIESKIFWIFIGAGLIVAVYVLFDSFKYLINTPVLTLAYISISLGAFSVTGFMYSIKTNFDSETRMRRQENIYFSQLINDLLADRMNYRSKSLSDELFTWYLRIHLERADILNKKWIMQKFHLRISNSIFVSLDHIFSEKKWNKLEHHTKDNIKQIYRSIRGYYKGKHEESFNQLLSNMEKNPNETEEQFYTRLFPND